MTTTYPRQPRILRQSITPAQSDFVADLNPEVWFKFDEASGNIVNYGSYGVNAVANGAIDYGVTDSTGGNDAIRFNASPEYLTMADSAALGSSTFSFFLVFRAFSAGIGTSLGRVFQWGSMVLYTVADVRVVWEVPKASGTHSLNGDANQLGASYPAGWFGLLCVCDASGNDLTFYQITAGGVTTKTLENDLGAVNAFAASLYLANRADTTRQGDYAIGEFGYIKDVALNASHASQFQARWF